MMSRGITSVHGPPFRASRGVIVSTGLGPEASAAVVCAASFSWSVLLGANRLRGSNTPSLSALPRRGPTALPWMRRSVRAAMV
jgi:hypothetical protein